MTAVSLQTEYMTAPLGLDAPAPLFTWKVQGQQAQTGCCVRVYKEEDLVWDSGRVDTPSPRLVYGGKALDSRTVYRWKVCLYNGSEQGTWSEETTFETGLLHKEDWQARWIGIVTNENYVVLCRHVRELPGKAVSARAYLAAEGFAQLWINGSQVCQDVLDPANTDYSKRVLYRTFDITGYLHCGANAFGVRLNRGWAERAKCLLQIHVTLEDGTETVICTRSGDWKIALSPIYYATLYGGEFYDARLDDDSWNLPTQAFEETHTQSSWGFFRYMQDPEDAAQRWWFPAIEMPAPAGVVEAQTVESVRNLGELTPVSITPAPDGSQVVDFGQNIAGWVRIRLRGQRGFPIQLEHSELLNPDGSLNMDYLTSAAPHYPLPMQRDTYVPANCDWTVYEPQFTYHGFRYVAVRGLDYTLQPENITAVIGCSNITRRSVFRCGNPLVEQIYNASVWSEKTNMHGIPTDCPQRAERQGWLNDMTARAEAAVYQFDLRRFYRKFTEDIRTAQDPVSGAIPDVAPYRHGNFPGDPVDCYLQFPYWLYWHYGDKAPIERSYESMKKLTMYWERNLYEDVLPISLYGDWTAPEEFCVEVFGKKTPVSQITNGVFVSTCLHYYNLQMMAEFAAVTDNQEDEAYFTNRVRQQKQSILRRFYDPETGSFAGGSQGENALALYFGLVPEGQEERTVERILKDLEKRGGSLTTGNLCTKYIMEVLSMYGHVDKAYELITRREYPSWGYMIEHGATTLWERWEYKTGVDMNSHNHAMYGSIVAWMHKYLAGISPLEPGFRRVSIKPYVPKDLPSAGATVDTPYGTVECAWHKKEDSIVTEVTVPLGMEAEVRLPDGQFHVCTHGSYRFISPKN